MSEEYHSIFWKDGAATIKSFTTASTTAGAQVKIEMLVHDSYTFARICEALHELKVTPRGEQLQRK